MEERIRPGAQVGTALGETSDSVAESRNRQKANANHHSGGQDAIRRYCSLGRRRSRVWRAASTP
jgi:hypothetical protein